MFLFFKYIDLSKNSMCYFKKKKVIVLPNKFNWNGYIIRFLEAQTLQLDYAAQSTLSCESIQVKQDFTYLIITYSQFEQRNKYYQVLLETYRQYSRRDVKSQRIFTSAVADSFIYLFIFFNENQVTSPFIKKYSVLVLLVLHPLPLDDEFLFIVSTKHERLIVLFSLFMSLLQLGVRLSVKSNKASLQLEDVVIAKYELVKKLRGAVQKYCLTERIHVKGNEEVKIQELKLNFTA